MVMMTLYAKQQKRHRCKEALVGFDGLLGQVHAVGIHGEVVSGLIEADVTVVTDAQQWGCWIIRQFYFQFSKESPHCSPQWLY